MSPFQLAKHHGTTSCYRKYLLSSETPLVIETTSCYRKHLLLSRLPLVIEITSCYRKHLLLSETPYVIGNTSCYRKHLLLSRLPLVIELPLVIGNTSCYRKHLMLSETPLVIGNTSCYREHFLLSTGIFVRLGTSYLKNIGLYQSLFKHLFHSAHQLGRVLIGRSRLLLPQRCFVRVSMRSKIPTTFYPEQTTRVARIRTSHLTIFDIPMRKDERH